MMRRLVAGLAAVILPASLLTASAAAGVPDPDPCDALVVGGVSNAELRDYTRCRMDRLEDKVDALAVPSPFPTPTPTDEPEPTETPTPTEEPTSEPPAPAGQFPTRASAGTPDGWTPETTRSSFTVTQAGATIVDTRVNGSITIAAPNVTLRRVDVVGGRVFNDAASCYAGLLIEDSTVRRSSAATSGDTPAVAVGGYTARNVLIDGLPEGFRVGGKSRCGPVTIEDSYTRIVAPDQCGDWHGDGIQGYDGGALTVRNTVLELVERSGCGGTAPFFYPSGQGNTSVDIDGMVVKGGGFAFRLGMPGTVANLHIVQGSWGYGPIAVACSVIRSWRASISTLDAQGQPTVVRAQPCNTSGGS